ncbi:hypothetical protein Tco_1044470 [Tanacetum coccineum]|uniref:Reverse transcriptase Ty1/copia-type domain-containing protein n=1 Tax=Tanacetum coccineum TaxID=301880 RepID=A0ABQ5GR56_9ASTR
MVPPNNLGPNLSGKAVNETRYQANPKETYLIAIKRIFRYLKCSGFDLKGYSDSDYAGCNMDKKSTSVLTLDDSKIWVSTPTRGIREDIGINIFRNALRAHYLPHSSMYVSPPFITIVRPWFTTIGYSGEIREKRTLKKSSFPLRWRLLMGQVIQCLGGKTGGLDQISNKDATILYCLANRVKVDYAMIIWEDIFHKLSKKTREKVVPYPRFISLLLEYMMPKYENKELTINLTQVFSVHNWALKPNQTEGPPFTDHMRAICNLDVPVDPKAPKPSSQTEEVPKAKRLELKSSLAKDKSLSHPSPPTLVVGEMHKEAQQATGSPTSLRATSEDRAHPQLSSGHDALADSTAEADPGLSTPNDSLPSQQDQTKSARDGLKTAQTDLGRNESRADEISKKIKLEDLSDLLKDTRSAFLSLSGLPHKKNQINVLDESKEEKSYTIDKDTHASSHDSQKDELEQQKAQAKAEVASLKARPSYPDVNQLTTLLIKTRMEYLDQTEEELKIDFNKPLKEQDHLNELNELANKKIKRTSDLKDHPRIENVFVSLLEVYKAEKRIVFYVKKSKANSLGNVYSEFGIDYNNFPQRIVPITRKKTCAIKMELSATHVMLANIAMINL